METHRLNIDGLEIDIIETDDGKFIKPDIIKNYSSYHSGKKPLKSMTEIIYVFHKPTKYGSYIEDVMAYERGEKDIHVSCFDIGGNRIGNEENEIIQETTNHKRYPTNILLDEHTAELLDEQSGELKSGSISKEGQVNGGFGGSSICYGGGKVGLNGNDYKGDSGGASRFFQIIPYFDDTVENFIWSSKVSKYERNAGCENLNDIYILDDDCPEEIKKEIEDLFSGN